MWPERVSHFHEKSWFETPRMLRMNREWHCDTKFRAWFAQVSLFQTINSFYLHICFLLMQMFPQCYSSHLMTCNTNKNGLDTCLAKADLYFIQMSTLYYSKAQSGSITELWWWNPLTVSEFWRWGYISLKCISRPVEKLHKFKFCSISPKDQQPSKDKISRFVNRSSKYFASLLGSCHITHLFVKQHPSLFMLTKE